MNKLSDVIQNRGLSALYQPVIDMTDGSILGYDGLVRGPSDSLMHAPGVLFSLARQSGLVAELENLCCQTVIESFASLRLDGLLFLKVNAEVFLSHKFKEIGIPKTVQQCGLDPPRIVVELVLNEPGYSDEAGFLPKIISRFSSLGFQVAIRDQGEIFFRLESMRPPLPGFLKINRYLIRDIERDPVKSRFIRTLVDKVGSPGTRLIAEGIETRGEFLLTGEMGITLGQGNLIARPGGKLNPVVSSEALSLIASISREEDVRRSACSALIETVAPFSLESCNDEVFWHFEKNPWIKTVAVVDREVPIGLISRSAFIDRFARPYQRELYGKKSCSIFMDPDPLIVDKNISIQELGHLVAADQRHMLGFIFTDNGCYLGMGSSQKLIHEITQMQIHAARYSNPLTGLPGNIPIEEHMEELLDRRISFCVCYFDLDSFKPFNDRYGFSMGDEMIKMTASVIANHCDSESDFLGHVGGDDFVALFRSADWEAKCRAILDEFGKSVVSFFDEADIERGGYYMENRRGENEFHTLTSLSIGAVIAEPGAFGSYREIAKVAAESKKRAKKTSGNSLFINQRRYPEIPQG